MSARQEGLSELVERALSGTPALKEALDLYQMGQAQYNRALSGLKVTTIVSSSNTNPEETTHAIMDRDETGDHPTK